MNAAELKTLFNYHYWANRQIWDCVLKLTDEQFTHDLQHSIGSLAHRMVVAWMWFVVASDRLPTDRA
jgi:uncharacterized damage-inducible protein DinB